LGSWVTIISGVIGHKDDPSFVSYVHVCVPLTTLASKETKCGI
jgi:hypothetical protein